MSETGKAGSRGVREATCRPSGKSKKLKAIVLWEDTEKPHNLGCGSGYYVPPAFLRVRRAASIHLSSPSPHWPPTFPEKASFRSAAPSCRKLDRISVKGSGQILETQRGVAFLF